MSGRPADQREGSDTEELPPGAVERIVAELGSALRRDFGGPALAVEPGWTLVDVSPRRFRRTVPVVTLAQGETRLCFIVIPTRAGQPAYRRTPHHDLSYFSEDVPDAEQHLIYARDRRMIDAFVAWFARSERENGSIA